MTDDQPRVLIEGGPVHRRITRQLAVLLGLWIGAMLGLGGVTFLALDAAHGVKLARERSVLIACHEANVRHAEAVPLVVALVERSPLPPGISPAARDEAVRALTVPIHPPPVTAGGALELRQIDAFVQIIAPAYDCPQRLRQFLKA